MAASEDDDGPSRALEVTSSLIPKGRGVTWARARSEGECNKLSPPIRCPAWICCLLPCLLATDSMRRFRAAVPESALALRENEWVDLDASSLVVDDVLRLAEGDLCAADARVLEATDFVVSNHALTGDARRIALAADDLVPLSARCLSGTATLLVTAVGDDTLLAKRLRSGQWPPPPKRPPGASEER